MSKFSVGDRVIVVRNSGKVVWNSSGYMDKYIGREVVVSRVKSNSIFCIERHPGSGDNLVWIFHDDDAVLADTYYDNQKEFEPVFDISELF